MVTQSLLLRHSCNQRCLILTHLLQQIPTAKHCATAVRNLFDCAGTLVVWCACAGAQRTTAMFEMVTAVMGLVGAGIFLAHAFEGVLSRI